MDVGGGVVGVAAQVSLASDLFPLLNLGIRVENDYVVERSRVGSAEEVLLINEE